MKVYIPFSDGSSVAFDGTGFTLQERPRVMDEALGALPTSKALEVWTRDWGAVVRALESAWARQRDLRRRDRMRQVYSIHRVHE